MNAWELLAIGGAAVGAMMFVLWLVQLRTGNAAIVDVGWAGGLAGLAILYAALADGLPARRALVATMGGLWGLRLA
ncbi:MAG TPA: DUF1295 domain-containing protein, partial [Nitrospiria bacterium]|nr:DUF1295 domain-containing protein [Nitrospiria bacterium]